jgi:hypothetical protein
MRGQFPPDNPGAPDYAVYSPVENSPIQDPPPDAATALRPAAPSSVPVRLARPRRRRGWRTWLALAVPGAVLVIAGVATVAGLVTGSAPPAPSMATSPAAVLVEADPSAAVISLDQEYLRFAEQAQNQGDWATVDRFLDKVDNTTARDAGYIAAADAAAQVEAWDWVEAFLDKVVS